VSFNRLVTGAGTAAPDLRLCSKQGVIRHPRLHALLFQKLLSTLLQSQLPASVNCPRIRVTNHNVRDKHSHFKIILRCSAFLFIRFRTLLLCLSFSVYFLLYTRCSVFSCFRFACASFPLSSILSSRTSHVCSNLKDMKETMTVSTIFLLAHQSKSSGSISLGVI
jgi:hypothetical protein